LFIQKTSFSQVRAIFSSAKSGTCIDPTSRNSTVIVSFEDNSTSTDGPLSYKWDFGDGLGGGSVLQNPSWTYSKAGIYYVTLTVTSSGGTSNSATQIIDIYEAPKVVFSANQTTGCNPFPVLFTGNTVIPNILDPVTGKPDKIVSWIWNFGDGPDKIVTSGNTTTHSYILSGNKKVRLQVETEKGCVSSFLSATDYIKIYESSVAGFIVAPPNSCQFPVSVKATNTTTNSSLATYKWSISGANTANIVDPLATDAEFIFDKPGNYKIKLESSGPGGCPSTFETNYFVPANPVVSGFNSVGISCENTMVDFVNISTPNPTSNNWFVDGVSIASTKDFTYKFTLAGTYTVRLESIIGNCPTFISVKTILISKAPVVSFTADSRNNCNTPFDVKFTGTTSPDATKRVWDFGDGATLTENAPFSATNNHTYSNAGRFPVKLVAFGTNNCSAKDSVPNFIEIQLPVITKKNLPDSGCAPLSITPNVQFSSTSSISSWKWTATNFNGKVINAGVGQNPGLFTFADSGIYKMNLTVETGYGCIKSYDWDLNVGVVPNDFDFLANPLDACASSEFVFKYVGPPITGLKWKFSPTDSSLLISPSKKFKKIDAFDISLTAYIYGCPKTLEKPKYVNVKGVIAQFVGLNDCAKPFDKLFNESSIGKVDKWDWDFGDNSPPRSYDLSSKPVSINHVYSATGQYRVKLKVSGDGCEYTDSAYVNVANENNINFTASKLPICVSDSFVTLTSTPENTKMVKFYDWNFGCGFNGPGGEQNPRLKLDDLCGYSSNAMRGNYPIQLKITDANNCIFYSPVQNLFIGGPIAHYENISPISGCDNLPVQFEDKSTGDGVYKIVSRIWDFGDTTDLESIPSGTINHVFTKAGSFPVTLRVTDERGCVSQTKSVVVQTSSPNFDFVALQTASCPGKVVQFETQSKELITSYFWNLGEGVVSDIANPSATYSETSKKTISLTIKDFIGCEKTIIKRDYVEIDLPVAKYLVQKEVADCSPFRAEFTFDGGYAEKFEWEFGDSAVSIQQNPTNIYNIAGTYPVKLKVTSPGGCTAVSAPKNILVLGPRGTVTFSPVICEPFEVKFTVSSPNTKFVKLDYGDGNISDSMPYNTTFTYKYADTGFYLPKAFLVNDEGCTAFIPVSNGLRTVSILPVFKPDITFYCDNGTVQFSDFSLSNEQFKSWEWDYGDGTTGSGKVSSHFYAKPGIYDVKVKSTTISGCTDSLTRQKLIEIQARPDMEIVSSKPQFCEEDIIQFDANEKTTSNSAVVKWFWDFTNGQSSTLKKPLPQLFRKAGNYPFRLYATNDRGCIDTVFNTYLVNPLPRLNAGVDTFVCLGTPVKLNVTGASQFDWVSGPTLSCTTCATPTINPVSDAAYIVKGTSVDGCVAYDSVKVLVVNPTKVIASPDVSICFGESVNLYATGSSIISWALETGLFGNIMTSPTAKPNRTTTYRVYGNDAYGCFPSIDSVVVNVNPLPTVNAGNDTTMMAGYPLQLKPTYSPDVTRVQWVPSLFLNCSDCKLPISTPLYSATYTVFAYTANGCMAKDVINVYGTCTKENLFIPNTFSPNGDGTNDIFYPRGRGVQQIKAFKIFNRWGQLIYLKENFRANDQSAGWDGTKKQQFVLPDVYVYMVDLVCENGNIITIKGDVTLIR
jgi:gliding motility-associated-like protein